MTTLSQYWVKDYNDLHDTLVAAGLVSSGGSATQTATPTLSGVESVNAGETSDVYITNYDSDSIYFLTLSGTGGSSYSRSGNHILFNIPSAKGTFDLNVYAANSGEVVSNAANHSIEITYIYFPFTMDNGSDIGSSFSKYITGAGSSAITINNNKLRVFCDANNDYRFCCARTTNKISGDMDVQVDYTEVIFPHPTINGHVRHGLWLWAGDGATPDLGTYVYICRYNLSTGDQRITLYGEVNNNNWIYNVTLTTSPPTSGKLRIVRSGTSISFYYWSGSDWILSGPWAPFVADDVYVMLGMWDYSSTSDTIVDYDNLYIY